MGLIPMFSVIILRPTTIALISDFLLNSYPQMNVPNMPITVNDIRTRYGTFCLQTSNVHYLIGLINPLCDNESLALKKQKHWHIFQDDEFVLYWVENIIGKKRKC